MINPILCFVKKTHTKKQMLQDRRNIWKKVLKDAGLLDHVFKKQRSGPYQPLPIIKLYPAMHGPVLPVVMPINAGLYNAKNGVIRSRLLKPTYMLPYVTSAWHKNVITGKIKILMLPFGMMQQWAIRSNKLIPSTCI